VTGGDDNDYGWAIDIDQSGDAYVTGYTSSLNFPTTVGAFDDSHNGGHDLFVVKVEKSSSRLAYSTLLGASGMDEGRGIAATGTGDVCVTGDTESPDFPTSQQASLNYATSECVPTTGAALALIPSRDCSSTSDTRTS